MARITLVCRLTNHDIGILYKDDQPVGGVLMCLTDKDTNNIAVNIEDFENARLIGISYVIFKIIPIKWIKVVPMQRAIELMKYARQLEGKEYKLISKFAIEGNIEIPDDENIF